MNQQIWTTSTTTHNPGPNPRLIYREVVGDSKIPDTRRDLTFWERSCGRPGARAAAACDNREERAGVGLDWTGCDTFLTGANEERREVTGVGRRWPPRASPPPPWPPLKTRLGLGGEGCGRARAGCCWALGQGVSWLWAARWNNNGPDGAWCLSCSLGIWTVKMVIFL